MWAVDGVANPSLARDIIEGLLRQDAQPGQPWIPIGGDCWLDVFVNDKDTPVPGNSGPSIMTTRRCLR